MIHYGADYNPEQWDEATWHDDVERMREAGVTLVNLGIFAWARIQPAEGQFDWEWLDRVLELMHEGGVAVDLATATASPPPWATTQYPAMLPRDEDGTIFWPGSRQAFAPSSADYRRLAAELVSAMAARYADHPAVVMWHVNNEYGCHLNYDYSDNARDAFRVWLRAKYGSIDALNSAWGTAFWAQIYTDFEQVIPPRKAPYSRNPAALVDFKRFTSDTLLELFTMERDIIRAAGAKQPITTNFMGAFQPADYWKWSKEVDVIADDCYPDPNDPESFRSAAFARDLMRSLKPDVPWILMEQASNAVNWRPTNAPKAPGQMAALSMQAVARGADGIMFFQWRQSRSGSEKFHSAMLPQAGTNTRTWREVTQLGATLASLPELPAGSRNARVAIVFEWESWWAIGNPDHPVELDYLALVERWHAALHRQHIQVDLVRAGSNLSGYSLVVAPQLYMLSESDATNLITYVESGGSLFVGAFSDVVDENDAFRSGGFLTQLRDLLGIWLEDFGALVPPAEGSGGGSAASAGTRATGVKQSSALPGQVYAPLKFSGGEVQGTLLAEEIHVVGAETLGVFDGGRLAGRAAFSVNQAGKGRAYYVATIPDADGCGALVRYLCAENGIEPVLAGLPESVEAVRRGNVLTLLNHGDSSVVVSVPAGEVLAREAELIHEELNSGAGAEREVVLPPHGYVLIELST